MALKNAGGDAAKKDKKDKKKGTVAVGESQIVWMPKKAPPSFFSIKI